MRRLSGACSGPRSCGDQMTGDCLSRLSPFAPTVYPPAARLLKTRYGRSSIPKNFYSITEVHMENFDRRSFIRVGSLCLFGFLSWSDVLRLRAQTAAAKRDLSVIHLWLTGG